MTNLSQSNEPILVTNVAQRSWSRREFLSRSATAALATGMLSTAGASSDLLAREPSEETVSFFLISDTHYLADEASPAELDERSRRMTSGLIDTLNNLPGTTIPAAASGGKVLAPRGVIHAGDLIDSGDKNGKAWEKMQATEWQAFTADYGIDGKAGRLKYPTFEVHGNHDGPQGIGVAMDGIRERNKTRKNLTAVSSNGLHCSWDWGLVHFLNLGLVVGQVPEVTQRRRYNPLNSLDFLIEDLQSHVGTSGRPVVITHHLDMLRYSLVCEPNDPANLNRLWHPSDVRAFYQALRDYNVLAIMHGHTHARKVFRWDGGPVGADEGIAVFNVDNASHFRGDQQAFLYFEIGREEMLVRECATIDGWKSHFWTPQTWNNRVQPA